MLYGDYREPNPPAEVVRAVERGDVDVALVWGPLAGYFAAQSPVPLRLEPVTPWFADQQWPMQFDVSVGVQKDNQKLLTKIDRVLVRRSPEIRKLLAAYHVPLVGQPADAPHCGHQRRLRPTIQQVSSNLRIERGVA